MKNVLRVLLLFLLLASFGLSTCSRAARHSGPIREEVRPARSRLIAVSFPNLSIEKTMGYDLIRIEGCSQMAAPGQPVLPVKSITIKLPERSIVSNVRVDVKEGALSGAFRILPGPYPMIVGSESGYETREDPAIYNSPNVFPGKWYACREGHGLDPETNTRVKYLFVDIYPIRFLPVERIALRAENVSITIDYAEPQSTIPIGTLDNLIIASPLFEAQANRLAEWKNYTGISTRVLTTAWIYSHYGGVDDQEKIRNCIEDSVTTYGIVYVTLFGDADQVPVRSVYVPDGIDTYTATDLYYADLDGTWDDNGDGLYADLRYDYVDGIPDVYVGRLPVSYTEYGDYIVSKIIGYQESFSRDQAWTNRIVLAAGTGDNGAGSNLGNATTVLNEYISSIADDLDKVKLYESAGNLSTDAMRAQINNGCLFLDFAGHGDPGSTPIFSAGWLFYWVLAPIWWNGFGIPDVRSTTNEVELPVVTTMSCSTARFDDTDCIGEWFVGHPTGGAIAYFGSTRVAWCFPDNFVTAGLMGEMDWRIYETYYEGFAKLGKMWGESISRYVAAHPLDQVFSYGYLNEKTIMEFVLLGDPTLGVRSNIHIKADGSVDPPTAPIHYDGNLYTLTDDIEDYSLVVERDNIVVDGAGHTLQGVGGGNGVTLTGRNNVKIINISIRKFSSGLVLSSSTNDTVAENIITGSGYGIQLSNSSQNTVLGNAISQSECGIGMYLSSNSNRVLANNVTNNHYYSIYMADSTDNTIYHNLMEKGFYQVIASGTNNWDGGYPSGGNSWSDYTDVDLFCGVFQNLTGNDGIGDSPYAIDTKNVDRYPLIQPWSNDTVAPQVVIHSPYNQTYPSNSIPLTLQINEPSSWIGYSLDGQTNTTIPGKPLSFTYRKSHVINNATGAGTDYQIRIVVWRTSGTDSGENICVGAKCKPDFGDVRFASSSERLDYWLETYDSLKATFWVKIAGNLSDTTQTIFVYYGSPQAATTSNGVRTFLIFKDLTLGFFQSMGYSSGTYSNTQDPGDYFISSSYTDSTYVNPCIWFRYYGLKQYAVTPTYLYFKGGMDGGNHGNCGMDLRVSNASTPIGWSGSMSYVPSAALDKKHIVVTDYSGTGHLYFYSTFQTYDDIPEGNIVDSYYFNSSSRTASEKVYRGSIAHIMPFAPSDSQLTIYHQYYAAAKYVSSEPIHGSWGNEEIGNACPTLNTSLTIGQDGPHCVIVYANDTVGNIGSSNIVYFTIDTTPPSINIVSPQNNVYYSESIPLTFEINETAFWIGYSLDNQSNVTINGNTMINMEDGLHQIVVYANDTAGNMGSSYSVHFAVNSSLYDPWKTSFIGLGGYPIVDFAVYNGKLYAAADNTLYVYDGYSWNIINTPTFVVSLEPYQDKLIVGGQGGLYSFDGATFNLVFTVPTYIKVLGVYNNTLHAGTILDKPPTLYYCNGLVDNPADWHVETDFSAVLSFSGAFGSIDSFGVYDNAMYVGSGGKLYSFNGASWSIAASYDDVYAFLDMQVYNGKLYLATRDQGWRKPMYLGGSGFSGRVIEFDGENWITAFDHDYWIYSLEEYDGKLYAGTANKILTYNGTSWETSFSATEGAYYAISMINYDGKIYAGMGNGYMFADPAPLKAEHETIVVPEFPSTTILAVFTTVTMLAAALTKKNPTKRLD